MHQKGQRVRIRVIAEVEVDGEVVGSATNGIVVKVDPATASIRSMGTAAGQTVTWMAEAGADASDPSHLVWMGAAHCVPPKVVPIG